MGTTLDEKYTVYPKSVRESNEGLDAMFEEQRKAREAAQAQPNPEPEPQPEPQPEPEPEPQPEPELSPEMVSKSELEKAEQKYLALQGKYDKEVPDLYRQNTFLYQTVQGLQREVEALKTKPVEKKLPTIKISLRENPKIQALKAELSPEVFENLVGAMEETTEVSRKVFEEETEKLRGEFKTTRVTDQNQIFWAAVNGAHRDYPLIANDPKLQEFLAQPEGYSGFSRGDFFIDAYKRRDSETYIRYLNAFKEENPTSPNPEKKLGEGTPNPDKLKGKIAAPKPSGPGGPTSPAPKTMTKGEATAEYERIGTEFGKGLWNGREKEYDKKEAALIAIINSS